MLFKHTHFIQSCMLFFGCDSILNDFVAVRVFIFFIWELRLRPAHCFLTFWGVFVSRYWHPFFGFKRNLIFWETWRFKGVYGIGNIIWSTWKIWLRLADGMGLRVPKIIDGIGFMLRRWHSIKIGSVFSLTVNVAEQMFVSFFVRFPKTSLKRRCIVLPCLTLAISIVLCDNGLHILLLEGQIFLFLIIC